MNQSASIPVAVIRPGKVFAANRPVRIQTLLGSCVSVCLCDRMAGAGGMNHFMLPGRSLQEDPTLPARYGIQAMELLINALHRLGADRRRLQAMAFGGADVLTVAHTAPSVAEANVAFVHEFLETERIPLVESLLGGTRAMRVAMQSTTGEVMVEFVRKEEGVKRLLQSEKRLFSYVDKRSRAFSPRQVTIF